MKEIEKLKSLIIGGKFPKVHRPFGGANLIITDNPDNTGHEGDVVILTPHASALSWLTHKLKDIFDNQLNASNKYDFYPRIGELIQESLATNEDLFETMLYVVNKIEKEWGEVR
jgi:hypothetical protein